MDPPGRIDRTEAGGESVLQVQADQVAIAGSDLLADDDAQLGRRKLARRERAIDALVVRDGEVGQTAIDGSLDHRLWFGQRIKGRRRVTVKVGEAARGPLIGQIFCTSDFLKNSKCSRARPVPTATQFNGFSATWQGTPVTWVSNLSMLRSIDPPPDMTMPLSMMSLDSSGGVFSSTPRTAVTICWRGVSSASITSELVSGMVLGKPAMRSRPRTSMCSSRSSGNAAPIAIFTSSAVRSPIIRLYFLRT